MKIDRRQFLQSGSIITASFLMDRTNLLFAQSQPFHISIAKQAKKISKGSSLTILYPKGSLGNLLPVIKSFTKHSNVEVKLKQGTLDKISSEMILDKKLYKGVNFDIALPATFGIPDLVEANVIEELSEFSEKYEPKSFKQDSLYNLGDYYKGKFYGYQADGDAYLMFYNKSWLENKKNKDLFQKRYGRPLDIPKTWEELDQQIAFFNNPKEERYGGNLFRNKNYILWEFWMRLHSKGYFPFKDDMTPQIDSDASIQALEELIGTTKNLDPNVKKDGLFDNFKRYANGNSYCNLGWGGTQKYLNSPKSKIKNNMIFSCPPGGNINGEHFNMPYFNWGWNYTVSKKCKQKELAYLFCLFASTSHISTQSVRESSGYFDPFRKEHYEDKAIQKTYGKDFLAAHKECLEGSIPDLYLKGQGQYLGALKQALFSADQGLLSPKASLVQVRDKWDQITEKMNRIHQIEQWKFLKKSYPDNIKKLLKG